jgi:hypothetical protein
MQKKKYLFFYYLRFVYYFGEECFNEPMNP